MRLTAIILATAMLIPGCDDSPDPKPAANGPKAPATDARPAAAAPDDMGALYQRLADKYPEDAATIRDLTTKALADLKKHRRPIEVDTPRLLKELAGIPLRKGSKTRYADAILAYCVLRKESTPHDKTIAQLRTMLDPPLVSPNPRRNR